MQPDIGIAADDRKAIVHGVSRVLADSYTLMLKTLNFHWNVKGPMFNTLHLMFEQQYNELLPAVDGLAERIRALGEPAPASYSAFGKLTSINDEPGVPAALDMVRQLMQGHEAVARTAREVLPLAQKADDEVTADMLIGRMQIHEKTAWMLRTLLEA
ncbi:MAG: DNA starvation/stationary phase protection protein [Myxococcales bacterium]|nr:DNA starvation/stationary phase protection protein [Myxococcales bacterium]